MIETVRRSRAAVAALAVVAALALFGPGLDGVRCGDRYFDERVVTQP